jgi:hypothetical protein
LTFFGLFVRGLFVPFGGILYIILCYISKDSSSIQYSGNIFQQI